VAPSVQRRKVWLTPNTGVLCSAEVQHIVRTCGGDIAALQFFPNADTCLTCEDIAQQNCVMVPIWRFFGDFLRPVFSASRVQHVSDLHLKFALRLYTMCGSMADIQSAKAEIRRGKKIEETTGQIYNGLPIP